MMFLYCEGFDYDFEVAIFDRDYDEHKDKVDVGKVVIIEGNLDINFEYRRKSIRARNIVAASLTQVREQARDMGLLDNIKRMMLTAQVGEETGEEKVETPNGDKTAEVKNEENFEIKLEEKITENKLEKQEKNKQETLKKYVVIIPAGTKLDKIHELKDFLGGQTPGVTDIFILLGGKEIDTKFSLEDIGGLVAWETKSLKR